MDDELIALLDEVHRHGVEHDAGKADRLSGCATSSRTRRDYWLCSYVLSGRARCWSSVPPMATRRCGWPTPCVPPAGAS